MKNLLMYTFLDNHNKGTWDDILKLFWLVLLYFSENGKQNDRQNVLNLIKKELWIE